MTQLIGTDAGCAGIKLAFRDNNGSIVEFSNPSVAKLGKAAIGMGGVSGVTYECDGEEWSISESFFGCEDTRFDEYPFSSLNATLTAHTLLKAGLSGELRISSGLPINQYYDPLKGPRTDLIKRKHDQYKLTVNKLGPDGFEPVGLDLKSFQVSPESLSGWADVCFDEDGSPCSEVTNPVGLVDIGGRTTDIAVVTGGLSFNIEPEHTGTLKVGYLDLYEKLNELLSDRFHCGRFETPVLDHALRTGEIKIFQDEPVEIVEQIEKAKKIISREIMREVGRKFSNVKSLAGIAYFGGGAEDMRADLVKGQNVIIPERAQFANARGYLKIALSRG